MSDIPRLETDFTPKTPLDVGSALLGAERIRYYNALSGKAQDELDAERSARDLAGQYDLSTDDGKSAYGNALMGVRPKLGMEFRKSESGLKTDGLSQQKADIDNKLARLGYGGRLAGAVLSLPDDQIVQGFGGALNAFKAQFPGDHALDGLPEVTNAAQARQVATAMLQQNLSAKDFLEKQQIRETANYLGYDPGVDPKVVSGVGEAQALNEVKMRGQDFERQLGEARNRITARGQDSNIKLERERLLNDPTHILGADMKSARALEEQGVDQSYMTPSLQNALNYTGKGGAQYRYGQSHAYQDPSGAKYSQAVLWRQYQKDAADPMNVVDDQFPKTFGAWLQGSGFSPANGGVARQGRMTAMSEPGGGTGAIIPHDGDSVRGFVESNPSMRVLFKGLTPGTPQFAAKWDQVARRNPEGFAQGQLDYAASSLVAPLVSALKSNGFDVERQPEPIQSLIFSTATQFGPNTRVIHSALDKLQGNASPADVIVGITNAKVAQKPDGTVSRWTAEGQQALNELWASNKDVQSMARYPDQAERFLASIPDKDQRRRVMAGIPKDVAGAVMGQARQQSSRPAGVTVDPALRGGQGAAEARASGDDLNALAGYSWSGLND